MAERRFELKFGFGTLKQAIEAQGRFNLGLDQMFTNSKKTEKIWKSQLGLLEDQKSAIEVNNLGIEEGTELWKKSQKQIGNINKEISGVMNPFEKMLKKTPMAFLVGLTRRMSDFNAAAMKVNKAGGFMNVFSDYVKIGAQGVKAFSGNMTKAFGGSMLGAIKNIGSMIKLLAGQFVALLPVIASVALPIVAIIAGVLLLKRMWEVNFGGIQQFTFQIFGQLQDIWGRFSANLNRSLAKLSPLFKLVFGVFFKRLGMQLKFIGVLFDVLFKVAQPILDAFHEIGVSLQEAFAPLKTDATKGIDAVKIFTSVMERLTKIFIFIVKYSPFTLLLKGVVKIIKFVTPLIEKFAKFLDTVLKVAQALGLINREQERSQQLQLRSLATGPVSQSQLMTQQITNRRSTEINHNQQVSVHSSGPITPESAPMIGDVLVKSLSATRKVL